MKIHILAMSAAALVGAPAFAVDVSGTTSARFINPAPASAVTTGIGTNDITFGVGSPPNRLTFNGNAFASAFETPFKVGSLSYYNGSIDADTGINSVDLSLALSFTTPSLPPVTSNFTFNVVNTPNTGSANDNADYLYFPSSFSTSSFLINGTTYNVKLTGFGNIVGDGFLASNSSQLHVRENASAKADVFAIVTTQSAVPEPATWAMFISGFGFVGGSLRRRQRAGFRFA